MNGEDFVDKDAGDLPLGHHPSDLDNLLSGLSNVSDGIENIKKNNMGVWWILGGIIALSFMIGGFWFDYKATQENGSPAFKRFVQEQRTNDQGTRELLGKVSSNIDLATQRINQLEKTNDLMEKRLQRLEDRR